MNEKTKVTIARGGVIACGVAAWVLALSAESIFELVHAASEFGSAGFFIVVVLGLFTRWGDARAAMATLITGMAVWLAAAFIWEYQYSYLLSLAVSLVVYLGAALAQGLERRSPGSRIHPQ